MRFEVKSILTTTYENWSEIRTVLNMAKMASSVRAHWFKYTGRTDPKDFEKAGKV
jgi:hypothetical protein